MKDVVEDFKQAIEAEARYLLSISERQSEARRAPGSWSPKEIVGHLIDSAANNHGRFVGAQFRDDLVFEGYAQGEWVAAQGYADEPWVQLVDLWRLYNLHLLHAVSRIPAGELSRPRHPHSLHLIAWRLVDEGEPATLEYLIRDYVAHLKHHVGQIRQTCAPPPAELRY